MSGCNCGKSLQFPIQSQQQIQAAKDQQQQQKQQRLRLQARSKLQALKKLQPPVGKTAAVVKKQAAVPVRPQVKRQQVAKVEQKNRQVTPRLRPQSVILQARQQQQQRRRAVVIPRLNFSR